ncbi:MAG: GNAT family N-acetyltransferase [Anaerolineae bacterium]|jgi:GNAT superfamily N-acetyltransferase|nr:GNAT family N-acetyltransferase [Anaerolineae bacterium]
MNTKTNERIMYDGLKQVDGLVFRHFAGEADHQIRLDIANACKEVNGFDWIITLEDIKNDELWSANYDIDQQLIYVELDGEPIGYFGWNWQEELNGTMVFWPWGNLVPAHWGKGIEEIMLQFTEEQCRLAASGMPEEQKKIFRTWRKNKATDIIAFLQQHGYRPERFFFEMSRPIEKEIPDCPLPEGIEIRPVEPSHYRAIWDADQEAFHDHWGYAEPTEQMFEAWQKERHFRPQYWKVAWEGDQVCGMVRNYFDEEENKQNNRQRGWTEEISVRRPWRGKGLAKALIAESIRMFRDMGMEETALGVDSDNPNGALKLYETMGYEVDEDKKSMILFKALESA